MDEAAKVEEAAPEYVKNVLRNHFKKKSEKSCNLSGPLTAKALFLRSR